MTRNVLIVGGSGYLGQFLVQHLSSKYNVSYTYNSNPLPHSLFPSKGFKLDLTSEHAFRDLFRELQPVQAVVNCAAISQPALCENDYDLACTINVPSSLVTALQQQKQETGVEALLIHISTDQVSSIS
jgi:dTDP-4-dehydrorhamnose reductase